jgi:hypothetical protein
VEFVVHNAGWASIADPPEDLLLLLCQRIDPVHHRQASYMTAMINTSAGQARNPERGTTVSANASQQIGTSPAVRRELSRFVDVVG